MERWLLILRHGKSERGPQYDSDYERPLAPRGVKSAHAMGQLLAAHEPPVELIVASPAVRALHTAEIVQAELNGIPLTEDNALYAASLRGLLDVVSHLPDEMHCIILVAHNPGLEEITEHLSGDHGVLLKTCSLARIKLDGATWADAVEHTGSLAGIHHPRESAD